MGTDDALVAVLADKFAEYRPHTDERGWRLYLGSEARAQAALRECGLAAAAALIARAAGVSRATVMAGAGELAGGAEALPGRSRRPGAGRPEAGKAQPGLREVFLQVVKEGTRGDPMTEITWCSLSLRDIAGRLAAQGFSCGKDAAARLMRGEGYSLQSPAKVLEGRQHPDRDAQFGHINAKITGFCDAGEPVISVDTKKKEYIGPFHRDGQTWRPKGNPVRACQVFCVSLGGRCPFVTFAVGNSLCRGQTGTRSPNVTANAFIAAFQPYVPVPRSPLSRTSPSPSICRPVIFLIPR